MTSIFITGNRGYIGSFLSNGLDGAKGCDIGWFSEGSSIDFSLCKEIRSADVVIHLAGHSSEPMCNKNPRNAWINNVDKFRNLVENLSPDQTLIYASSASVYDKAEGLVDEKSFTSSSRPYDCTKIVGDAIAQMHINQGKNIVGLRFGTVAGAAPVQRIDTVINAMTLSAVTKGVISCVDPSVRRTMLFLPDLLEAVRKVIDKPVPGIYNLGSSNTTVGHIGDLVSRITGADMDITHRNSNFYDFHLDCSLFKKTFGDFKKTTMTEVVLELKSHLPSKNQGRRDDQPFE